MLSAFLLSTLGLGGCGHGDDKKKSATQVVARVNGDEISVHQVNFILGHAEGITEENAGQAKREILDKLIDQQLAVQQAEEKKLDRSPAVMQAVEAAKREILSRAYLEQIAGGQPKVSTDEAHRFYGEHPELFAQRRVFNLQQLLVAADAGVANDLAQWAAQGKSLQDIAAALSARKVKFTADAGVRGAEQMPMESLAKITSLKDGQTAVITTDHGTLVVRVLASEAKPVDEATAVPRIQQYLANRRNSDTIAREMKALREKARIEKLGEFADGSAPAANAIDDKTIAKGVTGLK